MAANISNTTVGLKEAMVLSSEGRLDRDEAFAAIALVARGMELAYGTVRFFCSYVYWSIYIHINMRDY